jgi:hypothetical protein
VEGKATFFNLRAAKHVSGLKEELTNREDLPRMPPEQWNLHNSEERIAVKQE